MLTDVMRRAAGAGGFVAEAPEYLGESFGSGSNTHIAEATVPAGAVPGDLVVVYAMFMDRNASSIPVLPLPTTSLNTSQGWNFDSRMGNNRNASGTVIATRMAVYTAVVPDPVPSSIFTGGAGGIGKECVLNVLLFRKGEFLSGFAQSTSSSTGWAVEPLTYPEMPTDVCKVTFAGHTGRDDQGAVGLISYSALTPDTVSRLRYIVFRSGTAALTRFKAGNASPFESDDLRTNPTVGGHFAVCLVAIGPKLEA